MSAVNTIIIPSVIFVGLEAVYWYASKAYMNKMFDKSDSVYEPANIKKVGIFVHLIIELFAIIYFLILGFSTILNAFIFGLVIGGATTSINYALVKDWNLNHSLLCTLWKGVVFALVVYFSRIL